MVDQADKPSLKHQRSSHDALVGASLVVKSLRVATLQVVVASRPVVLEEARSAVPFAAA